MTIRVLIVDDHPFFREGVRNVLTAESDIEIVGEVADGEEALRLAQQLVPDVVVLDINLPSMNGLQVARQLKAIRSRTRVVTLTGYDEVEQMLHAVRAGAMAYCNKDIEPEELITIIRQVMMGKYVIDGRVMDENQVIKWLDDKLRQVGGAYLDDVEEIFVPLSPREMEILDLVTRGMSNKQIAYVLGISHQTVKNHMTSILNKLDVEDRTQAAVYALSRGWVRLRPAPSPATTTLRQA